MADNKYVVTTNCLEDNLSLIKFFDALSGKCMATLTTNYTIGFNSLSWENNSTKLSFYECITKMRYVLNFALLQLVLDYFNNSILTQEITLLNAMQEARAQGQLYEMGTDSQRIFDAIGEWLSDEKIPEDKRLSVNQAKEIGDAIRNALLPLIRK